MTAYISVDLRRQVRDKFANRCAYCQTFEHLTVTIFEIEHIVPLSAGGETAFGNLCLACPTCNRYKWAHQWATDPETGEQVLLFHPQLDEWQAHFQWNKTATEIIGLTAVGRATVAALRMNRPQLVRLRRMWAKIGEHP